MGDWFAAAREQYDAAVPTYLAEGYAADLDDFDEDYPDDYSDEENED